MDLRLYRRRIPSALLLLIAALAWPARAQERATPPPAPGPYTAGGYVTDAETGEVLIGAHVAAAHRPVGTTTNAYGFFSLTLPADTTTLHVSYVGYRSRTVVLYRRPDAPLRIELTPIAAALDTLEVTADGVPLEDEVQMSRLDVDIADVQTLPVLLGEADLLKTIQLLPGIQSGTEGSSGLYVRGGGPDQNLMLLDGAPVYNAAHLFGFFSTFNTDALSNVEVYKGGFPARYGGRLSSVLDVQMRDGNLKRFEGRGAVGLIASRLTVEGPLRRGRSSFIVSARRTYLDLITRPLQAARSPGDGYAGYYFYDFNAKANALASPRDRVFLSVYAGHDRFYLVEPDDETDTADRFGFGWRNATATLRWNRIVTPRLFARAMLLFSRFHYEVEDRQETRYTFAGQAVRERTRARLHSGIRDWTARVDVDYLPHPAHDVRFGASVTRHRFTPGVRIFHEERAETVRDSTLGRQENEDALAAFVYAEDAITLSPRLSARLGVHVSGFGVDGRVYAAAEPRLAARLLLPGRWALKASYVATRQYLHLLTNSGIGLPTDLWVPSTARIRPEAAWQAAAGLARRFADGRYEASIEGFYKPMRGVLAYTEGAATLGLHRGWEEQVMVGRGRAYGVELFLQKQTGRTTGWIGYTLSWSTRRFPDLNGGRPFPYRYDRRHDVAVVLTRRLRINTLSVAWVYGTGQAITLPAARYADAGTLVDVYDGHNGHRMRAYHRLDVSVHTPRRGGRARVTLSVYNLYNRQNPLFLYVDDHADFDPQTGYHDRRRSVRQVSLFPVIPSLSYSFTF